MSNKPARNKYWVALTATLIMTASVAVAYRFLPAKWSGTSVSYFINPVSQDLSAAQVLSAIQAGANAWHEQSRANFRLEFAGQTSSTTVAANGRNDVFFRNTSSSGGNGVIATTYTFWRSGRMTDADMVFWDGSFQFFTGNSGCSRGMYVEDVAAHEFGHFLGLDHSSAQGATMAPSISTCSQSARTLASDDIAGIEALYGVRGGGGTNPNPTPNPTPIPTPGATPNPTPFPTPGTTPIPPGPTPVPTPSGTLGAPSNLQARATRNSIRLSWNDNSTGETLFRVERSENASSGFTTLTTTRRGDTSARDRSVEDGRTYFYRVRAEIRSSGGQEIVSDYSNVVSASLGNNPGPGPGPTPDPNPNPQPTPSATPVIPPPNPTPNPTPVPPSTGGCGSMSAAECQMFNAINAERASQGVAALKILPGCVAEAQFHAGDMAANNYFSHDGRNETWVQRMNRFGVTGYIGENIAFGGDVATTVRSWMNSSGHRANILNSRFRSTGVGQALSASGRPYWVQCFSGAEGQ